MKPKENDNEEQTPSSTVAASSSGDKTPAPAEEWEEDWEPISTEELQRQQRQYVNLRVRLRSLAYAIQQTQRVDGEMYECYGARKELCRRNQACGLTVEEENRFARLEDLAWNKGYLRQAWHVAVTSLLLALVPKHWAEQGKPTGAWDRADGVVELDPDQELDFEEQIFRDFMPSWSREAQEEFLAQFDPRQRRQWIDDEGWTIGFGRTLSEYFKAPDLPRIDSVVASPRRKRPRLAGYLREWLLRQRGSP